VGVQQDTVRSLEQSLKAARDRFAAGSAVRTDVLNLEVQLAQAREAQIRARHQVQLAVAGLNAAVGREVVRADTLPPVPAPAEPPVPPAEETLSIENRPELRAARAVARAQEMAWRRARGARLPTLSAFGELDWDSDVSTDMEQSYQAGVMAEWDVFTGFQRTHAAAEARARYDEARAGEQAARDQLTLDLEQARLFATEGRERLDVAAKSVQSAEEALRITRERYQQGAADITELLTAEVGLSGSRSRHVAALYDCLTARSNLARARGDLAAKYTD